MLIRNLLRSPSTLSCGSGRRFQLLQVLRSRDNVPYVIFAITFRERVSMSSGTAYLLLSLPFAGAGFLLRRWCAVLLPAVVWGTYHVGVTESWWGNGFGDGAQHALVVLLLTGTAMALLGVLTSQSTLGQRTQR
jgi:hypothetical protein